MTIAELRDYLDSCDGFQKVYVWNPAEDEQTDEVTVELLPDGSVLITNS